MYKIELRPEALNDLKKTDKSVAQRIINKIKWLSEHFDNVNHLQLKGMEWKNKFKLRMGDYRIIYSFNYERKIISIHLIGHRSRIYE